MKKKSEKINRNVKSRRSDVSKAIAAEAKKRERIRKYTPYITKRTPKKTENEGKGRK